MKDQAFYLTDINKGLFWLIFICIDDDGFPFFNKTILVGSHEYSIKNIHVCFTKDYTTLIKMNNTYNNLIKEMLMSPKLNFVFFKISISTYFLIQIAFLMYSLLHSSTLHLKYCQLINLSS